MIKGKEYALFALLILMLLIPVVLLWSLIKRAMLSLELSKVLNVDCDPGKYIEIMERLSKNWNFKYSLKNIPNSLLAAYIFEENYDVAEMRAKEALGRSKRKKYKMYITSNLGRIYYSTDRYDKFLEMNKELKETFNTVKLSKAAKAVFEDDFLRQDALIAYKEGRLEDAKKLMESVKDKNSVFLINSVADASFLGDINYELGNYIEAATKYTFVVENGNKLKMVKEAQERVNEIKAKLGENQ